MNYDGWQRVREVFDAALRQPPENRLNYARQACGDDQDLLREVESLLASLDSSESFMEKPAVAHVADMIKSESKTLKPGTRFGHFEIIRELGIGGMGRVYVAKDEQLDRPVAIKILKEEVSRHESSLQRFVREAKAASALNHPNILVIHEIGEADDAHYIVSEFIEGRTLREILNEGSLEISQVLDISVQVASALHAAHEAHLVHRDIKPDNLMIRPDGYVKVLDFGLAKLVEKKQQAFLGFEESTVRQNQTAKGVILGTVNYMSPEQAKGELVDERTDIFSLGVVIYEMVAGRTPFAEGSMSETLANLINAEPQPLSRFAATVPVELNRIVSKMLRKNSDERYQTMKDVLTDLKDLRADLTSEEKLARPHLSVADKATAVLAAAIRDTDQQAAKTQYSFVQKFRRHKWLTSLTLVALIAIAIGITYNLLYAPKTATSVGGKKSIAVLPLKPIDTTNRDELYEVGIADSLVHRLGSMKSLIVRPLSATRRYTDINQDPIAAGKEQQVDYVLASNYQVAGGTIRITSQLFNVANGQIEETYKSEKDVANVFAMQEAIAGEVGNILLARFATESSRTAKRGTTNEEAYRLYLQGMYLYDRRSAADAQKAAEVLEQAVRFDPNYAQAWAGKAHAHRTLANFLVGADMHEHYQKSIEAINKALALDENLSEAYSALCENKMYHEYDFAGAERACQRAVELDPNSSLAHQIYARYFNTRGRHNEAIAEIKTAIDLEPTSLFNQRGLGVALYLARRYEEAVVQLKRVIAMDKNFITTYEWLIPALEMQGNHAEAFEWFIEQQNLRKRDEKTIGLFRTIYQRSGWQGVLREQAGQFDEGNADYRYGANWNAQIGNKDKAFEYLEKGYQRHELRPFALLDPRLDSLRDDPRFNELLKRVGLR